jgi:hypothetical protein
LSLAAFALLLMVAAVGAVVRGAAVERRGAVLFALAWAASLGAQALSGEPSPGLWLPAIDGAVLIALGRLAWRSPRPWPVYACGFQMLTVAGDVARWVETDLDAGLHLTFLALMSFGAVGALAIGAWFPPPPRQK